MSYLEPVQVLVTVKADSEEDAVQRLADHMPESLEYSIDSINLTDEPVIETVAKTIFPESQTRH